MSKNNEHYINSIEDKINTIKILTLNIDTTRGWEDADSVLATVLSEADETNIDSLKSAFNIDRLKPSLKSFIECITTDYSLFNGLTDMSKMLFDCYLSLSNEDRITAEKIFKHISGCSFNGYLNICINTISRYLVRVA